MTMEENDVYYVILNMNCQYEICRECPKSGIFKGTHEECVAFIIGTKNSDWPNARFCFIVELIDPTKNSSGYWSVQTDKAILYKGSKSRCEAFKKGIEYELKGKTRMEEKSNNLKLENDEPPSVKTNDITGYMLCDDENLNNEQLSWTPYQTQDEELRNNLRNVILSDIDTDGKIDLILALCRQTMVKIPVENTQFYPPKITLSKETT